jgi:hypothetical protein
VSGCRRRGAGRLVSFIIHLGVRQEVVARLTFRSLYPPAKEPSVFIKQEVGWAERLWIQRAAAVGGNVRRGRGMEVKIHKYCPSEIDVTGQPEAASDWPV